MFAFIDTSHFLTLDDDCILTMLEKMSLADLCTMAEVSVRLRELAQLCFRLKNRNLDMKLLTDGERKISMNQARILLGNFGHLIITLHVSAEDLVFNGPGYDRPESARKLFCLIRKYCTLEKITLVHFLRTFWRWEITESDVKITYSLNH